jgi:hypothetical protein
MVKGFTGWSLLIALTAALVTMPAATASAQNKNANRLMVPVTGIAAGVGDVAGNYAISKFEVRNGQLVAVGTVTASVKDATGKVVRTFISDAVVPVTNGGSRVAKQGAKVAAPVGGCDDSGGMTADASVVQTCDILSLVLGPLHLDLLGLVIDLNQVVLDITAQAGAGNLLGNLLCAITGLLDAGSLGQQIVNLLNQLIGVLGAL